MKNRLIFFLLVAFIICIIPCQAQAQQGVIQSDTLMVEQELSDVDVVGQTTNGGFQHVDAIVINDVAGVNGGVEGIVKAQMGVVSNSELSSQYRVRGGNFDENMVYVNNVEIYRPFLIRSGEQEGLSFVNPEMIDRLNFSSGGFDVSYSDKMSSVLNVKYKIPQQWGGCARLNMLGASAHLEGVVKKNDGLHYSHITGFRYKKNSYVLGSMDTKGDYNPTFIDLQSQHTWQIKNFSINALGYYSNNRYQFEPTDRETTFGTLTDTKKFVVYFEGEEDDRYRTGLLTTSASYYINEANSLSFCATMYRSKEQENYDILGEYWLQQASDDDKIGVGGYMEHARNELFTTIQSYALRGINSISNNRITWEAKLQSEHFSDYVSEWAYRDSAGYITSTTDGIIQFDNSIFADNKLDSRRLTFFVMNDAKYFFADHALSLNYGVRLSYWNCNDELTISPRASIVWQHGKWAYRLSGGLYAQTPFFRELRQTDGNLNRNVKAQQSWQVVAGADCYFFLSDRPFKFTIEAYYKGIWKLNPYSIDNVRIRYMADNCARGYAAGVDMKINGELVEGVESWACLSVMKTAENIEGDEHGWIPRPSDQRVNFSMFLQDYMPLNKSVGANLNFIIGSGLPFGPPNSERYKQTLRMPGYKRIDLGMFKDFGRLKDGSQRWGTIKSAKLGIEVSNLFDFSNTISYFWVADTHGGMYAVPNYLTSRRLNVKFSIEF